MGDSSMINGGNRPGKPVLPFAVDCPRFDGGSRLWACYETREQAEAAAAQLRRVGCHVVVRGPDDAEPAPGASA